MAVPTGRRLLYQKSEDTSCPPGLPDPGDESDRAGVRRPAGGNRHGGGGQSDYGEGSENDSGALGGTEVGDGNIRRLLRTGQFCRSEGGRGGSAMTKGLSPGTDP